ncbi:MAG TPA: transcriptional regulator [Microbacteriaceae bacterium]|jgi:transcriptional regulator with XRE-family HTH domain|nr:transcriptional regulator [Microbacteriaceae bacterium]
MESGNRLGEYLRARRETLTPEDAGLPQTNRRRVQGLRRDETATLAGISTDEYLRIEQGSDRHPSGQVLDRLAKALQLDDDETAHVHSLARPTSGRRRAAPAPETASASMQNLIDSWTDQAAFVRGRLMDVLAANPLASALSPVFSPGVNGLRAAFLDPTVREFNRDWEGMVGRIVAGLRALVGPEFEDQELTQLVGELSVRSAEFRALWARHDLRPKGSGITLLQHPIVGPLDLRFEKLAIAGTEGQTLVILHAEPGSVSEGGLRRLAAIAANDQPVESKRQYRAPVSIDSKRRQQ